MSFVKCIYSLIFENGPFVVVVYMIQLVIITIGWVVSVSFTYMLLKHGSKENRQPNNVKRRKKVQYFHSMLIFTTMLLAIHSYPSFIVELLYIHVNIPNSSIEYSSVCSNLNLENIWYVMYFIGAIMGCIANLLTIAVYYFRLILILDGSIYQISQNKHNVFVGLLICCGICITIGLTLLVLEQIELLQIFVALFLLLYFILIFHLCFLLKHQLLLLIKMFENTENIGDDSNHNKSAGLVTFTKRLTILVYVTMISTVAYFIVVALFAAFVDRVLWGQLIIATLGPLDGVINRACMALQFYFFDGIYNKTCKKCEKFTL